MTKTTHEEAAALARQYAATFADKYESSGGTVPAEFTFTEAQLAALIDEVRAGALPASDEHISKFLPAEEREAWEKFSTAMAEKLHKKYVEGYSGFDSCTEAQLSAMLYEHLPKGDPVDVANFCMFLFANGQRIAATPPSAAPAEPANEKKLYIVMNEQGSEGVVFDDKRDAAWTQTGTGSGSSGFGVPCIGEEFRDSYGDGKLTLHEVSIAILSAPPAGEVQGDASQLIQAFDDGWRFCTKWANRDDLVADMDSKPYTEGRGICLAAITASKSGVKGDDFLCHDIAATRKGGVT